MLRGLRRGFLESELFHVLMSVHRLRLWSTLSLKSVAQVYWHENFFRDWRPGRTALNDRLPLVANTSLSLHLTASCQYRVWILSGRCWLRSQDFVFGILYDPVSVRTVDTTLKEHLKSCREELLHHVLVCWDKLSFEVKPVLLLELIAFHRDLLSPSRLGALLSYFCPVVEVVAIKWFSECHVLLPPRFIS